MWITGHCRGFVWANLVLALLAGCGPEAEQKLALTIYDRGAFVRDRRNASPGADGRLEFSGVPATLDPYSVRLADASGRAVEIREQNYEYDLPSTGILLDRAVGREVEALYPDGARVQGVLLSFDYGRTTHSRVLYEYWCRILVRERDETLRLLYVNDLADLRVLEAPPNLRAQPALTWQTVGLDAGRQPLELSYLASGLQWYAEYALSVQADFSRAELSGRFSIANHTGADFRDATVKLVAGETRMYPEVLRPKVIAIPMKREHRRVSLLRGGGSCCSESGRELFEYKLFDLPGRWTLRNNSTKRIAFFPARNIPLRARRVFSSYPRPEADASVSPVRWVGEFVNSKENGLGLPLPRGSVAVTIVSPEGEAVPAETGWIYQSPEGEKVELTLAKAAGLTGRCVGPAIRPEGTGAEIYHWRWELKNTTAAPAVVVVDWWPPEKAEKGTIKFAPHLPCAWPEARKVEITIEVPAKGRAEFSAEAVLPKGEKR